MARVAAPSASSYWPKAVAHHGARILGDGDPNPLTAQGRFADSRVDEILGRTFQTTPGGHDQGAVGRALDGRGLLDSLGLSHRVLRRRDVPAEDEHRRVRAERQGQLAERPGAASDPGVVVGQGVRAMVVPQLQRQDGAVPEPAQLSAAELMSDLQAIHRGPTDGDGPLVVARDRGEGVEEEVDSPRVIGASVRGSPGRGRDVAGVDSDVEPGTEEGRR